MSDLKRIRVILKQAWAILCNREVNHGKTESVCSVRPGGSRGL